MSPVPQSPEKEKKKTCHLLSMELSSQNQEELGWKLCWKKCGLGPMYFDLSNKELEGPWTCLW